ncbi:UNVERIFIED_CONTAM: phosphoglycerate dehydrogenase-like enzyme [Brevibacillus sp. OAP136]
MRQPKIMIYSPNDATVYADMLCNQLGVEHVQAASTPEEAAEKLDGTEVILGWKIPLELLASPAAASVRWIQSMGAGVDDLVRSSHIAPHVRISRVVGQYSAPMAEYVFAHLLAEYQNLNQMKRSQQNKEWRPFVPELLAGKTIGIAGLGSIGSEMVRKARAFDMTVHGLSYSGKQAHLVDRHFGPSEWDAFVRSLDCLVLVLPLTTETAQVINRELLLAMKPDACLVNVGRGKLIVEHDLIDVLREGHLRAAILDVFEHEPLSADSAFWELPQVRVTPHLSGMNTDERICRYFSDNLKRYVQNEPLMGAVDRQLGY